MDQQTDFERMCRDLIAAGVRGWCNKGGTIKELAEAAGISATTLKKLAYHETKRPQLHTVVVVLGALGYYLTCGKSNAGEAKKRRPAKKASMEYRI